MRPRLTRPRLMTWQMTWTMTMTCQMMWRIVDPGDDVAIDVADDVLFICTANVLEMMPNLLLDRMEIIAIAGYITDEKMHIAKDYLEKTTREDCGIKHEQIALQLVRQGPSNERPIARVHVVLSNETTTESLREFVKAEVGGATQVVAGSVEDRSNEMASETTEEAETVQSDFPADQIQCPTDQASDSKVKSIVSYGLHNNARRNGKGGFPSHWTTWRCDEESAHIAHTVARAILHVKELNNPFFNNSKLHLHVPAGATPKDGPCAGCTMVTSLLSLAMKKPAKMDLAMTGEVTLTGRILPIGGYFGIPK
ncbi:hypothetical protein F0562_029230 [Nyssa sinensis]|uniref:Lon proteolytic domain-containing protein n=1 Tax=Nyssa sinensis TaxID=561372 RepID=A0A5J5B4G6_9ASTE|nr:hypothetical protein F0562_029230 [Nyssa sinensis]